MITSKLIPKTVLEVVGPKLELAYSIGERHYHTMEHGLAVFNAVERIHAEVGFCMPVEAALAALYHDAVYIPLRHDNEDLSAELAMTHLDEFDFVHPGRVAHLVWATKCHFKPVRQFFDEDTKFLMDCDIFGFAAPWNTFREQNDALDKEFSAGKDRNEYIFGRLGFLRMVLESPVFNTEFFRDKYEHKARENIQTEIKLLEEEWRKVK